MQHNQLLINSMRRRIKALTHVIYSKISCNSKNKCNFIIHKYSNSISNNFQASETTIIYEIFLSQPQQAKNSSRIYMWAAIIFHDFLPHQGGVVMSNQITHTDNHQHTPLSPYTDTCDLIFSSWAILTVNPNRIM